jgi:2-polyprenyl-6-methoxyphenol hydroxylase-like FAD-dependent oxidoreductase
MDSQLSHCDVAIIGGGLAGLTLALQLKQSAPELEITVLERSVLPPPSAAHKVGESTVEIGAHYFSETLGLKPLLEKNQLRKFGFRLFFGSGNHHDLSNADELGVSDFLPVKSYQIDRGIFEADLAEILQREGVNILDACMVKKADIGRRENSHKLEFTRQGEPHVMQCQWIVDASSRFSLLKRQLGLAKPHRHNINAAWFRVDAPLAVDDMSDSRAWAQRCTATRRMYSTNHLMGSGYWVWIIPLVGGRTSIGLVADPELHPFSGFNDFDKMSGWLNQHEPRFGEMVAGSADAVMDFKYLKHFSHDCEQLWSTDQWAMTGEAGLFADPFYSPGSDFIAISNTFISDMILRSRKSKTPSIHPLVYEKMYRSFFGSTMNLYEQQYPGFGDARMMVLKLTWDYTFYWTVLAWLYFRNVMTDIDFVRSIEPQMIAARDLNDTMQAAFRQRATMKHESRGSGRFFNQEDIPVLANSNGALLNPSGDMVKEFADGCDQLKHLAPLLLGVLNKEVKPTTNCSLLGDLSSRF